MIQAEANIDLKAISDAELLRRTNALVVGEREVTGDVIEHLMELDRRELVQDTGYASLFVYCTRELGYAEGAALRRIRAARAAARHPRVLEMLRAGKLHLEAVSLLNKYLRPETADALLDEAAGKSKRCVEAMVARLDPRPERRDTIRRLGPAPIPIPAAEEGSGLPLDAPCVPPAEITGGEARPAKTARPTSPPDRPPEEDRVSFHFTGSERLRRKVERAKDLLRHANPGGDLEAVFEAAMDALLDQKDPERRLARRKRRSAEKESRREKRRSSARTRRIPRSVKDQVWRRDRGRCSFIGPGGRACRETAMLEFDHVRPFARGGPSDDPLNIRLLCRAHNQRAARIVFGPRGPG